MRRPLRWSASLITLCALAACGGANSPATGQPGTTLLASETLVAASSFGVTEADGYLTVDTGAGLVFKVRQSNGDIHSIHYKGGPELQDQAKGSHISSGIGAAVSYSVSDSVAKITLTTPTLVHYLLVRAGENTVYMATYVTAEPSVGELRWITRLNGSVLTGVPAESNLRGNIGAAESSDVFRMPDGSTRSKYYGNQRALDLAVRGVTGPGVGVFMAYGNRESSSGGPFHRDIQNQSGTDSEVYNYMNSGHNQTGAWRMGLHGPYALLFTDGATPETPNMAWMGAQHLQGWVPASQRGRIVGRALDGFDASHEYTVAFENAAAQYWTAAKAPSGHFNTPDMKPGTYTMTVYKDELAVHAEQVTVAPSRTTTLKDPIALDGDPAAATALWRIGSWDGKPTEFLNGDTIPLRHPSDVRNPSWGPVTYTVGAPFSSFPAAQWKTSANSPTTVRFDLGSDQLAAHRIRIGVTAAYNGARPVLKVNGWTSPVPAPSSQPKSRSLTIGTYRGNNTMFTYDVPASAFVAGANTLVINVASGTSGTGFLSPGYAYDALDLL